jgi:hypothetical protein
MIASDQSACGTTVTGRAASGATFCEVWVPAHPQTSNAASAPAMIVSFFTIPPWRHPSQSNGVCTHRSFWPPSIDSPAWAGQGEKPFQQSAPAPPAAVSGRAIFLDSQLKPTVREQALVSAPSTATPLSLERCLAVAASVPVSRVAAVGCRWSSDLETVYCMSTKSHTCSTIYNNLNVRLDFCPLQRATSLATARNSGSIFASAFHKKAGPSRETAGRRRSEQMLNACL